MLQVDITTCTGKLTRLRTGQCNWMMSESLWIHIFVLSHILWLQLLIKHNKWWLTAVRSVWTTALTELSQRLVSVLLSAQQGYLSWAQECELQQNGMHLTHREFFIMAKLYIRAVTDSFIRNVISRSPMSLQLFLTLTWPVFAARKTSKVGQLWVYSCLCPTPIVDNVAQGQAESQTAPTPFIQQPFSMPITEQYNCQRSLRTDSLQ